MIIFETISEATIPKLTKMIPLYPLYISILLQFSSIITSNTKLRNSQQDFHLLLESKAVFRVMKMLTDNNNTA